MYDCLCVYFGEVPNALTLSIRPSCIPSIELNFLIKSATFAAAYSLTIETESEQNFNNKGTIY
jgi:hypothetical protein